LKLCGGWDGLELHGVRDYSDMSTRCAAEINNGGKNNKKKRVKDERRKTDPSWLNKTVVAIVLFQLLLVMTFLFLKEFRIMSIIDYQLCSPLFGGQLMYSFI
jgi:hypothetical protein